MLRKTMILTICILFLVIWYVYADFSFEKKIKIAPLAKINVLGTMQLAEQLAKKQNPDVYLSDVVVIFPRKTISTSDIKIRYFYFGTDYKLWRKRYLNYLLEIDSKNSRLVRMEVYPIDKRITGVKSKLEKSSLDIDKIIEIAETQGGQEFRQKLPNYQLWIKPDDLWIVKYKGYDKSYSTLTIDIDGKSGKMKNKVYKS